MNPWYAARTRWELMFKSFHQFVSPFFPTIYLSFIKYYQKFAWIFLSSKLTEKKLFWTNMKFLFFSNEIYSNKLVKTCVEPIPWNSKTMELLTSVPIAFQLRIRDSSLTALLHLFGQKITYPYRVWWLTPGSHFTLKHPACCVHVWQKRAMVKACNAISNDLYQAE